MKKKEKDKNSYSKKEELEKSNVEPSKKDTPIPFIRNPEEKSTESQGGVSDSLKGGSRY